MKSVQGFTIIEALITFAIVAAVIGVVIVFQGDLFSLNSVLQQSLAIQRDSEAVLRTMVAELRTAAQSSTGSYAIEKAESQSLAFYTNINSDSLRERVHYFLEGKNLKRSVVRPAGNPLTYGTTTASEDVMVVLTDLVATSGTKIFSYYDSAYAGTSSPLAEPVDVSKIRLVGVTLVVDSDASRLPPPVSVSSQVTVRNLKYGP